MNIMIFNCRAIPWVVLVSLVTGCAAMEHHAANGKQDSSPAAGEPPSPAAALVARSIAFHDPHGAWGGAEAVSLEWLSANAQGETRTELVMTFDWRNSAFSMTGRRDDSTIEYRITGGRWTAIIDGASEYDDETRRRMVLDRDDGFFWRNYLGFLVGLPMKLTDPGSVLDPTVLEREFMGRSVLAVRSTFEEGVGSDIWYCFFDPRTAEMVGCQFFRDATETTGEYITFEGLTEGRGMRLPRLRKWFLNEDDTFLGTDDVRIVDGSGP